MGLGHEGRTPLLPVDDEADAVPAGMEPVKDRKVAFAGHAESVGHALLDQAFDNEVAGGDLCHEVSLGRNVSSWGQHAPP